MYTFLSNTGEASITSTKGVLLRRLPSHRYLSAILFIYIGNYSQAIDIANQVLKRDPTDFGALEVKAMSLIYMGPNNLVSEGHAVPWVIMLGLGLAVLLSIQSLIC